MCTEDFLLILPKKYFCGKYFDCIEAVLFPYMWQLLISIKYVFINKSQEWQNVCVCE